jgi:uncharacterized phiE125 gp8 family phage protein
MFSLDPSVSVAAPTTEPLTLDEVKQALDIAAVDSSQDDELRDLIRDARIEFERDTGKILVQRVVTEKYDGFPSVFTLTRGPVVSISSITYFDADNASQTLASSVYSLDAPRRRIVEAVDQEWPVTEERWDAVTVAYTAGESLVNEQAKQTLKIKIKEMFGDETQQRLDGLSRAYEMKALKQMRATYP